MSFHCQESIVSRLYKWVVCYEERRFIKVPFFNLSIPVMTESGVMCCDIHPKYPFLVAIGLYDGNVHVYNLKENYREPLYVSMGVGDKHIECVWEVGI